MNNNKKKIKIAIVGTGGIGGLLAILLSNKDNNVVCFNGKKNGKIFFFLKSNFYGNKKKELKFTTKKIKFFDIVFICVKYQDLKKSIKSIDNKSNKMIIPLLNGLSHIAVLKKKFKESLFTGNIGKTISHKENYNSIIHESKNEPVLTISSENKSINFEINLIKKVLNKVKIKVIVFKSDNKVVWTKLIRINAISSITALYNCNLGEIRKSKYKMNQLKTILQELIKLAKVKKVNFVLKNIMKEIKGFPDTLTTSMQRDIILKKKSELETILGAAIKEARKYNISFKMSEKVYKLIKKSEK